MNRLVVWLWIALATAANAQEKVGADYSGSYLCKTTASGGLVRGNDGVWQATTFNVVDDAYVISCLVDDRRTGARRFGELG
jgi:hypothetical protein